MSDVAESWEIAEAEVEVAGFVVATDAADE